MARRGELALVSDMTGARAAELLEELAFWLELGGANPFKTKAWAKAAEALEDEGAELAVLLADPALAARPGLGRSSLAALAELAATGSWAALEGERAKWPASLLELRRVRGLGAGKIGQLHGAGISSLAELRAALEDGRLEGLKGFGGTTVAKLRGTLATLAAAEGRRLLPEALAAAAEVRAGLLELAGVGRVEALGELRRGLETVGEVDLLVETRWVEKLRAALAAAGGGEAEEPRVVTEDGTAVRLMLREPEAFVRELVEGTGPAEFLGALRARAAERGLGWDAALAAVRTEEEFFDALGLDWIDPVLREGFDEVGSAADGTLPRLVEWTNLRGAFHNHTTASDGANSLREMAEAAFGLGLEYLGIADHSVGAFQANGLSAQRLRAQVAEIAELNAEFAAAGRKFRVFAGSEVEVKKDGSLDFDDELLAELDYVVAAVHVPLGLDEAAQTRRTIRALEHPLVTMLAHPSGRLLLRRPAMALDLAAVAEAAATCGTVVEINANPWRLDLDWRVWRALGKKAPLTSINPDAHAVGQLGYLETGVRLARKAGRSAAQVLNTRGLDEVARWLKLPKEERR